jgi:hypothetical protein
MKKTFILAHEQARIRAVATVANAPAGYVVTVDEPTRSSDQNAAMWPILDAFSRQLVWPVNGAMTKLSAEEWKDILTAAFQGSHVRLAQGLTGGVVMLGLRTSKMGKRQFSDFLEFLHSVAVDRGVSVYEDEQA